MPSSTLVTPRQAAEKLGMSYPALKHWILAGRIKTIKTPGGHHRIPAGALSYTLLATGCCRLYSMGASILSPGRATSRSSAVGSRRRPFGSGCSLKRISRSRSLSSKAGKLATCSIE